MFRFLYVLFAGCLSLSSLSLSLSLSLSVSLSLCLSLSLSVSLMCLFVYVSLLQASPVFFDLPFRYSGVSPFLSVSSSNRTRTSCLRLCFIGDSTRIIGGTAGGELIVWGGIGLGFEDLKRLPHSGGAVTAIELDCLQERLFVGDAAGQVATLSLALSPIETDPLEVRRKYHPSSSSVSLSLSPSVCLSVSLSLFVSLSLSLSLGVSIATLSLALRLIETDPLDVT